jgi:hypothetical protein
VPSLKRDGLPFVARRQFACLKIIPEDPRQVILMLSARFLVRQLLVPSR